MSGEGPAPAGGWARLLEALLALGLGRLADEKRRFLDALLLGAAALMLIGAGIMLGMALLIALLQERYRLIAAAALSGLSLATGLWLIALARSRLSRRNGPR